MPNTTTKTTRPASSPREDGGASPAPETPQWPPPRSPLPPQRLAKLANALGVSIPSAGHSPRPSNHSLSVSHGYGGPASSSGSLLSENLRRSPTPSAVSTSFSSHSASASVVSAPSAATSRFLLHVIPPHNLPHEPNASELSASGYHTQFRRGTLVPLYSSLQAQLSAIAKEYALPSTTGMILYLVSSTPRRSGAMSPEQSVSSDGLDDGEEPGPRISEDIWRFLWMRVQRAERDDVSGSRHGLGLGLGGSQESSALKPLQTPLRVETVQAQSAISYPATPSPSTPSSTSDVRMTSSKNGRPSSSSHNSRSQSQDDGFDSISVVSPSGSAEVHSRAESLDLPGLHSSSLIPILAKVEFDIDKHRAQWYRPWVRNRRAQIARRRKNEPGGEGKMDLELASGDWKEKYARGQTASPDSSSEEEAAPRRRNKKKNRKNRGEMALDGASLSREHASGSEFDNDDEAEVRELWNRRSRPKLAVDTSSSKTISSGKRTSSPKTANTIRKHVPPPIDVPPIPSNGLGIPQSDRSPGSAGSGTELIGSSLAYMDGVVSDDSSRGHHHSRDSEIRRTRSPSDEAKRTGAVFDDMELGFDLSTLGPEDEFDENDPYDRRKSQYIMRAKLDQIEKTLASLSPRVMYHELPEDQPHRSSSLRSSSTNLTPDAAREMGSAKGPVGNGDAAATWPAIPFSALSSRDSSSSSGTAQNSEPAMPRLAINGVSKELPKSRFLHLARSSNASSLSSENEARKRELEESGYTDLMPPTESRSPNSPVIPLSPDPFGRFPSDTASQASERQSKASFDSAYSSGAHSRTPSSRFSNDSFTSSTVEEEATIEQVSLQNQKAGANPGLVSMKSIKKLWRKSNKSSVSSAVSSLNGGRLAPGQPMAPMSQQSSPRASPALLGMPPVSRPPSASKRLQFDGESPYPVPFRPPPMPMSVPGSPDPQYSSQPPVSAFDPPSPEMTPVDNKRGSVRKSILKSWKSVQGLNQHSSSPSQSSFTFQDQPGENQKRRSRRPSVIGLVKGSISSIAEIPPSPQLPEQYIAANATTRAHRQSQTLTKRSSRNQLSQMQSPPFRGSPLNTDGYSSSRPSSRTAGPSSGEDDFNSSEFETMVSPKMASSRPLAAAF